MTAEPGGAVGTPSSVPIPDPTALTDAAIKQAIKGERHRTDGNLQVLKERASRNREVTALHKEITELQFKSVDEQLKLRDANTLLKAADDKTRLETALQQADKAAEKQNTANQVLREASEKTTKEKVDGQAKTLEEWKQRTTELEKLVNGLARERLGGATNMTQMIAIIAVIATIAFGILYIVKP